MMNVDTTPRRLTICLLAILGCVSATPALAQD